MLQLNSTMRVESHLFAQQAVFLPTSLGTPCLVDDAPPREPIVALMGLYDLPNSLPAFTMLIDLLRDITIGDNLAVRGPSLDDVMNLFPFRHCLRASLCQRSTIGNRKASPQGTQSGEHATTATPAQAPAAASRSTDPADTRASADARARSRPTGAREPAPSPAATELRALQPVPVRGEPRGRADSPNRIASRPVHGILTGDHRSCQCTATPAPAHSPRRLDPGECPRNLPRHGG